MLLLEGFPVQSCRHDCSLSSLSTAVFHEVKISSTGGGTSTNGRLCWIVAYCAVGMHIAVCPYFPPPFRVGMDAVFLVRASIILLRPVHSGSPVIVSIW